MSAGPSGGGVRLVRLAMAVLGLAPTMALALGPTGDLEVVARDQSGVFLQGVSLRLSGTGLLGERAATSGPDGRYVFRALPPGTYDVDASKEGHARVRREGLVLDAGRTATVFVTLPPGAFEEEVTVVGREPLLDSVRTVSQVTYDRDYLERVPVGLDARPYGAVAARTPSVVGSQVRGGSFIDNLYLVDGMDSGDPYFSTEAATVIPSAMEQVQVQTGAFSADLGRATGGVISVVTKSGGNEVSGTVDLRYGDGSMLNKGDHFDPDAIGYSRKVAEFGVGGPLVRERLWYFVAGAYNNSEDAPPGSAVTKEGRGTSALVKLTWQAAPSHTLTLLGMRSPQSTDNANVSPVVAPEASQVLDTTNRLASLRYVGVLAPNVVVDAQVANFRSTLFGAPQSGDYETRCAVGYLDGITSRNWCVIEEFARSRDSFLGSVTWQRGAHALRGGIDLQQVVTGGTYQRPGGGVDIVAPDATGQTVTVLWRDTVFFAIDHEEADLYAGYVQDEWRVHPRTTLLLGLRYSEARNRNDIGQTLIQTHLLEPRLGVSWDVRGDARNVLKATWSRFGYASTLVAVDAGNQNTAIVDFYGNETVGGYFSGAGPVPEDLNGDGIIEDRVYLYTGGGPGGVAYADGGKLDAPRTEEWSLSYDRQFLPGVAAGVTYVRRRSTRMFEDRFDEASEQHVIDNVPGLLRTYEALEMRVRGEWKRARLQASYVWSKNLGNLSYSLYSGTTTEWDTPSLSTNRWGFMNTDTRHALKADGYVQLPVGFEIGYRYTYVSGFAWTLERSALPYGREFPEGRGTRRLPHFSQLDLDFSKTFAINDTALRLIVSVLNVANQEAVTAVNTLETVAGTPTDYQRPRRFEVGVRVGF